MNYQEFKNVVENEFMGYLPEKYQHLVMNIKSVEKVNRTTDGMIFNDPDKKLWMSPTIYIDDLYKQYEISGDYREVFKEAAVAALNAIEKAPLKNGINYQDAKNNIIFQLINTEQNKGLLSNLPHRDFHDLSIIYRWVIEADTNDMHSVIVKNDLMKRLGFTEDQLFGLAVENYERLFPPTVRSMDQIIKEMIISEEMLEEMPEEMVEETLKELIENILPEMPEEKKMWVISNSIGINGSGYMLYDEILQKIANEVDSDLYILPSSVHEVLAISVNGREPNELAQWVNEINMAEVSLEERLSNQVYHYDKELRKLTMATNTPMKRLDGQLEIAQLIYGSVGRFR